MGVWLRWVFVAVSRLSLVVGGSYSGCSVQAAPCTGFPLVVEHGLEGAQTSVAAAHGLGGWGSWALKHRLSSRGQQTQLPQDMCALPGPKPTGVPLHCKAVSQPLDHQEIPLNSFENFLATVLRECYKEVCNLPFLSIIICATTLKRYY